MLAVSQSWVSDQLTWTWTQFLWFLIMCDGSPVAKRQKATDCLSPPASSTSRAPPSDSTAQSSCYDAVAVPAAQHDDAGEAGVSAAGDSGDTLPRHTANTPRPCEVTGCTTPHQNTVYLNDEEQFMLFNYILKYPVTVVCHPHHIYHIKRHACVQKCSNPLKKHSHNVTTRLQTIGIDRLQNIKR